MPLHTEKLAGAAQELRDAGYEVEEVAANMTSEEEVQNVVARHRERYGRLDVLGQQRGRRDWSAGGRARNEEGRHAARPQRPRDHPLLPRVRGDAARRRRRAPQRARGHTASIAGKSGQAWLSVYSATKFAVVGWTQAMNKELNSEGIKSLALCPGFVETPMTEFIREQVPADQMIRPTDVSEAVRFALNVSPACVIPGSFSRSPARRGSTSPTSRRWSSASCSTTARPA